MKVKTSELLGPALDWAVKTAAGFRFTGKCWTDDKDPEHYYRHDDSPSTDPAQGHPIVEREGIATRKHIKSGEWFAMLSTDLGDSQGAEWNKEKAGERYGALSYQVHRLQCRFSGPTLLIAAMRCFVASKLGCEIDIPEKLK